MVKIAKFFGYLIFFIAALLFFLPKENLYYLAEKELEPLGVAISNERLDDSGFALHVKDAKVTFKGIESANIELLSLSPWLLYNSIDIENIKLAQSAKSFVPLNIEKVNIIYAIDMPTKIRVFAKGDFGEAVCELDLIERVFKAHVVASAQMKKEFRHSLRNLKRDKNGEYDYEQSF